MAQLEASLEANEKYWFQVQPGEGKVRLKVIGSAAGNGRILGGSPINPRVPGVLSTPIDGLLKELSIPVNEENTNYAVSS